MSESVQHRKVDPGSDGQRLDNYLTSILKSAPKSLIYRIIRKGEVRVNGGRAKPMQKLKLGDEVRIPPVRVASSSTPVISAEKVNSLRERIVFDDRHYLVFDKPAGMAVHGGSGLPWGLIDVAGQMFPDSYLELGHRLDRETSGCLVLARNREALLAFQEGLKQDRVEKRYLCLLEGHLNDRVEVKAPIAETRRGGEKFMVVDEAGRRAFSEFRPLEFDRNRTLCEVLIKTGRTHQIRVHANHLGHPVVGDARYGDADAADQLHLHCSMMGFDWEERGHLMSASAPLPHNWKLRRGASR